MQPKKVGDSCTTRCSVENLDGSLDDALHRVIEEGARVVLCRGGKDVAGLVPLDDLDLLQNLEDRMDLEAAREALKEPGTVPWEKIKADLGL